MTALQFFASAVVGLVDVDSEDDEYASWRAEVLQCIEERQRLTQELQRFQLRCEQGCTRLFQTLRTNRSLARERQHLVDVLGQLHEDVLRGEDVLYATVQSCPSSETYAGQVAEGPVHHEVPPWRSAEENRARTQSQQQPLQPHQQLQTQRQQHPDAGRPQHRSHGHAQPPMEHVEVGVGLGASSHPRESSPKVLAAVIGMVWGLPRAAAAA